MSAMRHAPGAYFDAARRLVYADVVVNMIDARLIRRYACRYAPPCRERLRAFMRRMNDDDARCLSLLPDGEMV